MSFLPNIESMAKAEIAKVEAKLKAIDVDHDGLSDVAEAETLVTEAFADLATLEAKVTPTEAAAALNILFPGKFNATDISTGEQALAKLQSAYQHLTGVAQAASTVL